MFRLLLVFSISVLPVWAHAKRVSVKQVTKQFIQKSVVSGVAIALLACSNMSCDRISQPMTAGFTESSSPQSYDSMATYYEDSKDTLMSFFSEGVPPTNSDGKTIAGDSVRINLHDRTELLGDFRLSIEEGPYQRSVYAYLADGLAYDQLSNGAVIGSFSETDQLSVDLNLSDNLVMSLTLDDPVVNGDQINRDIQIEIVDDRSGNTVQTNYNTNAEWVFSLVISGVADPNALSLPSYRELHDAHGQQQFIAIFNDSGPVGQFAISNLLDKTHWSTTEAALTRRTRDLNSFAQIVEHFHSHTTPLAVTVSGDRARVNIANDGRVEDNLQIGGTTRTERLWISGHLQDGPKTKEWTLSLGNPQSYPAVASPKTTLSSHVYRTVNLEIVSVHRRRGLLLANFRLVSGIGLGDQYRYQDQKVYLDIARSLENSGW